MKPIPYQDLKREIDIFCELYSRPAVEEGLRKLWKTKVYSSTYPDLSSLIRNFEDFTFMAAPTTDHTLDEILNLAASHFKVPKEKLTPDDDFSRRWESTVCRHLIY